jgi:hypothetical protein
MTESGGKIMARMTRNKLIRAFYSFFYRTRIPFIRYTWVYTSDYGHNSDTIE